MTSTNGKPSFMAVIAADCNCELGARGRGPESVARTHNGTIKKLNSSRRQYAKDGCVNLYPQLTKYGHESCTTILDCFGEFFNDTELSLGQSTVMFST